MAQKKKSQTTQTTPVITDTTEEPVKRARGSSGGETVYIACGLQLGITFDDVDNGTGGTKTITLPGINQGLAGKSKGILLGEGNAVLTSMSREDWECIKRKHGKSKLFTSFPPLLMEVKSQQEFRARRDEIGEMRTGLSPVDPESVPGIEPAPVQEV